MPKYLLVYREVPPTGMPSPTEMEALLATWGAWIGKFMQSGNMIDPGDGLHPTGRLVRPKMVTDGPFIESKEIVGGYSVVQADNYDAAVAIAKECPVIAEGGSVEIREMAGFA